MATTGFDGTRASFAVHSTSGFTFRPPSGMFISLERLTGMMDEQPELKAINARLWNVDSMRDPTGWNRVAVQHQGVKVDAV